MAIENKVKKSSIIIVSDEANIYSDACIARSHQVKVQLGHTKISLGNTPLDKSLRIYALAIKDRDIYQEKKRAFKECRKSLAKMPLEDLEALIKTRLSIKSGSFIKDLKSDLSIRKLEVVNSISISTDNEKVKFESVSYRDNLDYLLNRKGIHIFSGERGTRKSKIFRRLFELACRFGFFPMYMSASRALSKSLLNEGDVRDYESAYADSTAEGVLGVILKLLLDEKYHDLRAKSEILIIDEIEDVLDLSTSGIVGSGSLEDRRLLLQRLEQQIMKSSSVLVADAFVNDHTVDWLYDLAERSGKTIYVYDQKSEFVKPVVRVMPYAVNIELSKQDLHNNEKRAFFSDAQHNKAKSKFDADIIAINGKGREGVDGKQEYIADYVQIDAAFTHANEISAAGSISTLASTVQAVFYNPAAKNGLSIVDPLYSRVSVLAHGTVAPNDLAQSDARFRAREQVWLSFDKPERRFCKNPLSILLDLINKEYSDCLTEELLDELLNDEYLKRIASRIQFKNSMRENYEFTVLTIYEHLGHKIEFFDDLELKNKGSKRRRMATAEEKRARNEELISAKRISDVEAKIIALMKDHASNKNKRKLESYKLRKFYRVSKVTRELLDFDRDGAGARALQLILMAEDEFDARTIDAQFKRMLVQRFLKTINLHDERYHYNNIDAKAFHEFLFSQDLVVGAQKRKAIQVFRDTFKFSRVSDVNALSTITSVLKNEFNIKPNQVGKKGGQRSYIANMGEDTRAWLDHIREEGLLTAA